MCGFREVDMPKISVVIPVLNEHESVEQLYFELVDVFQSMELATYEIVFIDDGSTDGTFDVLRSLHDVDPYVKIIQFRRNFGKSAALAAGFDVASGDIIFTMDGDLQDNPEEIPCFLEALAAGYDLVSGWKYPRHDPLSKTLPSSIFNWVVRRMTGVRLHDFNCGFKAYRRAVTEDLVLYGELHRYIPVLAHQRGYRVTEIKVKHRSRAHGHSKFGARRFARGFFDFLTVLFLGVYTWRPLHLFGWLGGGSFASGFLINLYLTILWVGGERPIGDRPLLMLGVLLMIVGLQFLSIGLLAEMFAFSNARDHNPYVIRKMLE
jgi:glycosyltransferase involved in cell wall biosynthesis